MSSADRAEIELGELIALFYDDASQLGVFQEVSAADLPPIQRVLLAHQSHMTVAVEEHHGGQVDVDVLEAHGSGRDYVRKILLARQSDQVVVQFGIVRLDLTVLEPEVRQPIESRTIPLGRVLIEHNVLREVRLLKLYRVVAAEDLASRFGLPAGSVLYGRTAMIWCNGKPAIELLEIVGNCRGGEPDRSEA